MSDKTLIQEHAAALETIRTLTGAVDAAKLAQTAAEAALATEQAAHKATIDALAVAKKATDDAVSATKTVEAARDEISSKNEKLAFALAHPSFQALAAAGLAVAPKQGGQAEDKADIKVLTKSEEYKAMKSAGVDPIACAKFYNQNAAAIKSGK